MSFSGFYLAMFLVLAALILRRMGFRIAPSATIRSRAAVGLGAVRRGFVPALVFGVAVGNVLRGVPFRLDGELRAFSTAACSALPPFALLSGLLSVAMLVLHGAGSLSLELRQGPALERPARRQIAAVLGVLLFAAGGVFVAWGGLGFALPGIVERRAVQSASGRCRRRPRALGSAISASILCCFSLLSPVFSDRFLRSWAFAVATTCWSCRSSLANVGIISAVGLAMFPFVLPSTIDPGSSLRSGTPRPAT